MSRSLEAKINHLEEAVAYLKNKNIFEGGTATFITKSGEVVEIDKEQYLDIFRYRMSDVFDIDDRPEDKELSELIDKIKSAKSGVGLYLKAIVGAEVREESE